jgi:hypothetical protein
MISYSPSLSPASDSLALTSEPNSSYIEDLNLFNEEEKSRSANCTSPNTYSYRSIEFYEAWE